MSDDLIKRKDAIKAFTFNSKGERIPFVDCDNFPVEFPLRYIVDTLVALLPADRPQGEWIFNPKDAIESMFMKPKCSKCGFESSDGGKFCPNCGARMEGEEE